MSRVPSIGSIANAIQINDKSLDIPTASCPHDPLLLPHVLSLGLDCDGYRPVSYYHGLILELCETDSFTAFVAAILRSNHVRIGDLLNRLTQEDIDTTRMLLAQAFTPDIGPSHGAWLSKRLLDCALASGVSTKLDLLNALLATYHVICSAWAPVVTAFCRHVVQTCVRNNIDRIYVLARDAIPFYPGIKRFAASSSIDVQLLDLSRRVLGLPDEIADGELSEHFGRPNPQRKRFVDGYLSHLLRGKRAAFVDVGRWGTLVKTLHDDGWFERGHFFFMFDSANPELIFGYTNAIVDYVNINGASIAFPGFLEHVNDAIEAFPKVYNRPQSLLERPWLRLIARPNSVSLLALAVCWYFHTHALRADDTDIEVADEIRRLHSLLGKVKSMSLTEPVFLPWPTQPWGAAYEFVTGWSLANPIPPKKNTIADPSFRRSEGIRKARQALVLLPFLGGDTHGNGITGN